MSGNVGEKKMVLSSTAVARTYADEAQIISDDLRANYEAAAEAISDMTTCSPRTPTGTTTTTITVYDNSVDDDGFSFSDMTYMPDDNYVAVDSRTTNSAVGVVPAYKGIAAHVMNAAEIGHFGEDQTNDPKNCGGPYAL